MNTQLLEIEPNELTFLFILKKQCSCSVTLTNNTNQYVAFKIKTTSPKKYCVRPNVGIIMPKSTYDFTVTMQAQREAPPDMICKDKFLIQSTVVPAGTTDENITAATFVKDSGRYIEENKLKVVLVTPPNSPVLSPINGTMNQGMGYDKVEILTPLPTVAKVEESKMRNIENLKPTKDVEWKPRKGIYVEELKLKKDSELKTRKDIYEEELKPKKDVELKPRKDIYEEELKPNKDVELKPRKDIYEEELKPKKDVELKPRKDISEEELKPKKDIELKPRKDIHEEELKPKKDIELKPRKDIYEEELKPKKDVELKPRKDIYEEELNPKKDAELKPMNDVFSEDLNLIKDVLKPKNYSPNSKELKLVKDEESKPKEDILDAKENKKVNAKEFHAMKDIKFAKDLVEMKSKLNDLEFKLVKAEATISKLTEERRLSTQERKTLQEQLGFLRKKSDDVRRVQVGFPLLFVCMVAIVSVFMGYHMHH